MAKKPAQLVRQASTKQFAAILIGIALVGMAALGYALAGGGTKVIVVDPGIPAGAAKGHMMGKADAPVQVIEFGDFECPGCGAFANVTEPDVRTRLIATGVVGFRFFDFPLAKHRNSWTAHMAAACADDQERFWEMHDRIYAGQDEWSDLTSGVTNPMKVFRRYASELGLDTKAWGKCVTDQAHTATIKGNQAEGTRRGISRTPTLIVGNKMVNGATYDEFKKLVDDALADAAKARADSARKPTATRKGAAR